MRRPTRRPGTPGSAVLVVLVLTALALVGSAQPSPAQPGERTQVPPPLARIELTDMSPRVVTTGSEPVLRVRGRVVNVGDRSITELGVRVQRDERLTDDTAATAAVRGVPTAPHLTRFRPLPDDLAPGQSSPFELEVALRSTGDAESLQINEPGVYPLLVNLNGKPDFGGTARLASVPLLLPVLGVPPAAPGAPPGPAFAAPADPTGLTIMWPLAAEPTRLPSRPGEPILIASARADTDPMAAALAPGGRLDGLVGALEEVVPPGSPLAAAICVAIDPMLLETVDAMRSGYRVVSPGGIHEGTGAEHARQWLDRLRGVVQGRCVVPLPYADPDVVALSRAGLTDLTALATSTGIRLVRDVLEVQPVTGISWPPGGLLDERALADLTALQTHTVLIDPRGLTEPDLGSDPAPGPTQGTVVSLGARVPGLARAAPAGLVVDPLLTEALAQNTAAQNTAAQNTAAQNTMVAARPTDTAAALAAQDGIGALVYRGAADPDREPVLLTPPRRWQASGSESTELLRTAEELVRARFLVPRELTALADASAAVAEPVPSAARYPPQLHAREIPAEVTTGVLRTRTVLRDLQVATVRDATADVEPGDLLDGLRLGLLRAMSSAWMDQPTQAEQLVRDVDIRLEELLGEVRIVSPPGPYTLAAADSPLLITVSNELPVGIQVQLTLSDTPGLRAADVGVELVPARSTRQFVIPAEVGRSGQFSVTARLSTPGGTPLGPPSTLHLRSTAFGTVTVALTVGAGAVLVVLVARRIARRVRGGRGQPAPG